MKPLYYNYRAAAVLLLLVSCLPKSAAVGAFALVVSSVSFVKSKSRSCLYSERLAADRNNNGGSSSTTFWKGADDKETAGSPPFSSEQVLSWISDITQHKAFHELKTAFGFLNANEDVDELSTKNKHERVKLFSASTAPTTTTTVDSTTTTTTESVHLKLGSEAMMKQQQQPDDSSSNNDTSTTVTLLHTYSDAVANVSLSGLNVPKRKFAAWVNYTLQQQQQDVTHCFDPSRIISTEIQVDDETVRNRLRNLWKQRRLLSDRTEVLAVYKSDTTTTTSTSFSNTMEKSHTNNSQQKSKRGGFPDLLHIYAERLSAIIQDEIDEDRVAKGEMHVFPASGEEPIPQDLLDILDGGLLGWLRREYGEKETEKLCADFMLQQPESEQYEVRTIILFKTIGPPATRSCTDPLSSFSNTADTATFPGVVSESVPLLL
jgi:hypothetical protein